MFKILELLRKKIKEQKYKDSNISYTASLFKEERIFV